MDIILSHVTKRFDGRDVLRDFSARIPEGKITCVMGASGSGKTTLLRLLAGFLSPDAGTITGVPGRVSMVFQEDRLCEGFSALTNVTLVAPGRDAEAANLLCELGLSQELNTPVRTMSGGMKRRVAIARALHYEAELLLLDEAFKGLDAENRRAAMDTVLCHAAGRTVLSVTHDPGEAEALGGRILRL